MNTKRYFTRRFSLRVHLLILLGAIFVGMISILMLEALTHGSLFKFPAKGFWNSIVAAVVALFLSHIAYFSIERIPGTSPKFLVIPTMGLFFFLLWCL